MNRWVARWTAALWVVSSWGCAPAAAPAKEDPPPVVASGPNESSVTAVPSDPLLSMIQLALDDAARRSGLEVSKLKVASAEAVTWSNGAIGCPTPGRMYTQALVPGFRIRIEAAAQVLEYHASQRGKPFYCPAERVTAPSAADSRI